MRLSNILKTTSRPRERTTGNVKQFIFLTTSTLTSSTKVYNKSLLGTLQERTLKYLHLEMFKVSQKSQHPDISIAFQNGITEHFQMRPKSISKRRYM